MCLIKSRKKVFIAARVSPFDVINFLHCLIRLIYRYFIMAFFEKTEYNYVLVGFVVCKTTSGFTTRVGHNKNKYVLPVYHNIKIHRNITKIIIQIVYIII